MPTPPDLITYEKLPPDGWTLGRYLLDPPEIAQVVLKGDWFYRDGTHGVVFHDGQPAPFSQSRRVRVVAGVGPDGKSFFTTAPPEKFDTSQLLHMRISNARNGPDGKIVYDIANDGSPSLKTVRSHGASRPGVEVKK